MTNSGVRVCIQALYGALIFASLLFGAIYRHDTAAFLLAALGVLAVVLSQSASIDVDAAVTPEAQATAHRSAIAFWWASIILAGISAVLLTRG